ncbi:hypothetical protein V6N12_024369 [Hibiscus sabdariffa]|uniref:AAA+ ATPase domain-containing protein n=1 Tax=Hibiscus sabdariffa TaxID=183260 RepID=A0ABR2G0D1_9ROSI
MEIATGYASNLVSTGSEYMIEKIRRDFSYVCHYRRRVCDLEKKVGMLKDARDRVLKEVDAEEKNGKSIHADIKSWLNEAEKKIVSELNEVKGLEEAAKIKCFIGLCPNFKARYRLSKRAEEVASAVDQLLQRGSFHKVSYRDVPEPVVFSYSKGFQAFESRKQVFYKVVEAVKDPSINMIGVYGMPGVGKTMLANEVGRQVREDKLFDSVVMAAVTPTPDIHKIQSEIAEMLGLKLEEQSRSGRASRLCERLKDKKILVILDDIWERLDPMEVGIPFGNEHKRCTILLTSRHENVVVSKMEAQKAFPIGILTQEEAWDLFKEVAMKSVESPDVLPIATEIAKKCAGLPIAISTVARALRNQPLFAWRDALRQLRNPSSSNFSEVPKEAYSAIKLSYNLLENDEQKETFLLCSLMGHHALSQDLLKYAMGLGLFQHVSTVEEARNRLLTVVSHLKDSCLLLDTGYKRCFDCFHMHDLICDVAKSIASESNRVFVARDKCDWRDGDEMKCWDKFSFRDASINHFPAQLKCPKLTFLHIDSKDPSITIPNTFFEQMKFLKVVDLTHMNFPTLPSSISLLANLQTLCLDDCQLGDIALIGELKNLEILSLLGSNIELLPQEIGQLTKLKLLDLGRSQLTRIPSGIFCKLCRLEELYMSNSFVEWEAEGNPSQQGNASLAELKALPCLTALDVVIPNAQTIPKDFTFEKLQRYNIFIGEAWGWADATEYSTTLKLKLQTSIGLLNYGIKSLLKKAENLHLDEIKGLQILVHESEAGDCFLQLKNLHIRNGATIQYILSDVVPKFEFLQLHSLTLEDLPKLTSFCSGNNGSTSTSPPGMALFNQKIVFPKLEKLRLSSVGIENLWLPQGVSSTPNLTSLILEGCANLKHVFSYSTAEYLPQLQFLEISDCKCIHEIISTEEMIKKAPISFPRLSSLKLKDLHKLIGFFHEDCTVEFPCLKILEMENCPELKGFTHKSTSKGITVDGVLFNEKVAFPRMEKISVSHLRNVKRIWYNQLRPDSFSNLKELKVEYCDSLVNIFSPFLREVFQRLETLEVRDCVSLEQVFQVLDIEEIDVVVTSRLRRVELIRLPNLKYVWNKDPGDNISFGNLQEVHVLNCESLKTVFPLSIAKGLLQLESLTISCCGVEEIVTKNHVIGSDKQEILFVFNQLSFLKLWYLPKLTCFYPEIHSTRWPKLKQLKTNKCKNIKIFGHAESQSQPLFLIEKVIPQLEEVSFCSDDIEMITDGQFAQDLFSRIKCLMITCYHSVSATFPTSFLKRFHNLEWLEVYCCEFQELFPYEGEEKDMIPKIKNLRLDYMSKMQYIWNQDSPLDHTCAGLESLVVHSCDSLISLSSSSSSFQNLTTLTIWGCKKLEKLVTSLEAQSLEQLVTLVISECETMREVIASEGDEATYHEIVFRKLKELELHCLQSLKSFCSGSCTFKFPSLEHVILSQCPRLGSFCGGGELNTPKLRKVLRTITDDKGCWAGDLKATVEQLYKQQVRYRGLTKVKLSEFPELIDSWSWSRNPQEMLDFENLELLEVCDVNNLRCIFGLSMAALGLTRLQHLQIKRCNDLEQVITEEGSNSITVAEETTDDKIISVFPRLQSIIVESCPSMTSVYLGSSTLAYPSLFEIIVAHCPNLTTFHSKVLKDEETDSVATFFSDKVAFPNLAKLSLCHLRNVKRIWNTQLQGSDTEHTFVLGSQLREVNLRQLPKLKHVWNKDVNGNISFENLQQICVLECESLETLFPYSIAKGLVQLEALAVMSCGIQEIVSKNIEGSDGQEIWFKFNQLSFLVLENLPNLKCFYPGMHSTTWPKLKELKTSKCGEMKIFGHTQSQIQQPLFLLDKIIPQLEEVSFTSDDVAMINDGQFVEDLFCHIKCLRIRCYHSESVVFPFSFLQRFYNLETLEMKCLWKQDSPLDHMCSSLDSLEVHRCATLINLSAASSSFQNLTTLDVWNCKSLAELITSSKAQSLERLVTLRIRECELIREVIGIASEGDEATHDDIIFRELKCLELHCLPNLRSFCSGNCTFNFPSLNQVIVSQCPTMKNFCHGAPSTPKLQMVQRTTTDYRGRWAGDLNATIEQLHIQDGEMSEEKHEDGL